MWKCPVCDQENNAATVCPTCGFDGSCDYEHYPTPFAVAGAKSTRALRREWEQKQGPGLDRLFPGPEQMAQADLGQMGITQARINTIQGIARALMEGRVDFAVEQPLERFIQRWVQLPGIGEWTAHYIAMRVLKHPDAFPAADLILRREANPQGEPLSTKGLQRHWLKAGARGELIQ